MKDMLEHQRLPMDFDEALKHVGEFGRYQLLILALALLTQFYGAFNFLVVTFIAYSPEFRCEDQASSKALQANNSSGSDGDWWSDYSPTPYGDATAVSNQCYWYLPSSSNSSGLNSSERRCSRFSYDRSVFHSTVVTEFDLVCDQYWLNEMAMSVYMTGPMVGCLLFGCISDRWGRRPSLLISSTLQVLFTIVCAFSPCFYFFVLTRFFIGLFTSASFSTGFVISMEFIGASWRTSAGMWHSYMWGVGYMVLGLLAYFERDWRRLQLAVGILMLPLLTYFCVMPESARFHLTQGRAEQAQQILQQIAACNKKTEHLVELGAVKVTQSSGDQAGFLDLFRTPKMRKTTAIMFFSWFVCNLMYYGISLSAAVPILSDKQHFHFNFGLYSLTELPAYACSHYLLSHYGRRRPYSASFVLAGCSLLLNWAAKNMSDGSATEEQVAFVTTASSVLAKFFATCSYAVAWVYAGELFPTVIRNLGVGSSSTVGKIGGIMAPQMLLLDHFFPKLSQLVYAVAAISAGFLVLRLHETNHQRLPETIEEFNLPNRRGERTNQVGPAEALAVDCQMDKELQSASTSCVDQHPFASPHVAAARGGTFFVNIRLYVSRL